MTPTDEIQARLDELGVEYNVLNQDGLETVTYFDLPDGREVGYTEFSSGNTQLRIWNEMPEQAIAATVGTEPDEATMLKLHSRMNATLLDMNEELLAYHPQDRENASSKKLIDCVIAAHQIVEDAATVGAGTCHMKLLENMHTSAYQDVYECDECGEQVLRETYMGKSEPPKFCPECGRKVIESKED